MNPFNAAKCLTAQDKILQKQHNYLIDLMQEQIKMLQAQITNGLSISNGILSLAIASAIQTGALSSTDWNKFNNKQNALTFGIVDDNAVAIDDPSVAVGDFARFTASGLQGLTAAEMQAALAITVNDLQARMAYVLEGYPTSLMTRFDALVNGA